MRKDSIITGAGLVSPLGNAPESFHACLCAGKSAIKAVSKMDGCDISPGMPAAPITRFDPAAFLGEQNFKPLDRSSLLSISAVDLCLKDGAWTPEILQASEMDLVMGTMFGNVRTIIQFDRSVLETGPKYAKPLDFANTVINAAGGQTAIWHNLRGANITVAGGKVSALRAIRQARLQQARGGTTPAIVGGMEALSVEMLEIFGQAGLLAESADLARPFREERTGFALGEGAGFIILEDEKSALDRGASVRGRIKGTGSSYDISHGADPDNAVQRLIDSVRQALDEADLTVEDLGFVIASLNGSPHQDVVEVQALEKVFSGRRDPVPVMSVSGHVGETLGASGLLQLIAALEILRTGTFPGHGACEMELSSLTVPEKTFGGAFRNGLIISLGLDGSSAAVILSQP